MPDVRLNQEAADGHFIMTVRQTWEFVSQSEVQRTPQNKQNVSGDVLLCILHAFSIHKKISHRETISKNCKKFSV